MPPSQPAAPYNGGNALSEDQIAKIRGSLGVAPATASHSAPSSQWDVFDAAMAPSTPAETQGSPGYVSRVTSDISARASALKKSIQSNSEDFGTHVLKPDASAGDMARGVGDLLSNGLQSAGAAAGGATDILSELPGVKQGFSILGDAGEKVSHTLMQNPIYSGLFEKYVDAENKHPNLTPNIASLLNIMTVMSGEKPTASAAGKAADLAETAKTGTVAKVSKASKAAGDAIPATRDYFTSLPADVQKVLKEGLDPAAIKKELQSYIETGKKSVESGGKELSPYELAGRDYLSSAMEKLQSNLKQHGSDMETARSTFADKPIAPDDIASTRDLLDSLSEKRLGTKYNGPDILPKGEGLTFDQHLKNLNSALEGRSELPSEAGDFTDATGRKSLVTQSSDKALLAKSYAIINDMHENGVTAKKLEDSINILKQDLDYQQSSKPKPTNSPTEGVVKQVIYDLKSKLETLGQDENGNNPYVDAKQKYGSAKGLLGDLEKRLGGQIGESGDYKNAASIIIRRLSPQDSGTRAVLRELESQTGVPVFQHAILSKFAMDLLHDNRVRSVLENISSSAKKGGGSVVKAVWDTAVKAIQDPEGKAMRILDKRLGKEGTQTIYEAVKDYLGDVKNGGKKTP